MRCISVLALACLPLLAAAKKPITIDTLMEEHPGPGAIAPVWLPDGKAFSFRRDNRIFIYDISSKHEKELLSLEPLRKAAVKPPASQTFGWQNRRIIDTTFEWSKSGSELLISEEGDLFLWHRSSGKWDQLTASEVAENDAKLSPDGSHVLFRRGHDLYSMDIARHTIARLTEDGSSTLLNGELDWVYPEELDLGTACWWSPDSQEIAFLQFDVSREFVYPQVDLTRPRAVFEPERYPQAGTPNAAVRIGVVDANGGPIQWMDLKGSSDDLIARVYWTPDSRAVDIERMNRVQNHLDFIQANPENGAPHVLFSETDPYWINYSDVFAFLHDGRFIWSSERDGYRHLYLYSSEGAMLRRLTEGPWEVTKLAGVDEQHGLVYFVSTQASPLQRQLYSVSLDGGRPVQITRGSGTHSISMGPGATYYLDNFSNLTTPPQQTLRSSDGSELAVLHPSDRKIVGDYIFAASEIVTLKAADGTQLYGHLTKPVSFRSGQKYPLIVMVYGGPQAQTVLNTWSGPNWDQVLAQRGFVIWKMDNRGGSGRGHAFETPLYHRFGKTELEDQLTGIQYLIGQGFIDSAKIGIYGWSYGGYMTLYSLLNAPDIFRAGIAGAPVTNWRNYDTIYTERYLGLPSEDPAGYDESSAITYAAKLRAKLLIVHNIEDDNVLFQNTMQMAQRLEADGKLFDMQIYPGKAHSVSGPIRRQLLEKTTAFFEETLK